VPSPHGALPAAKAPARLKKPILHRRLTIETPSGDWRNYLYKWYPTIIHQDRCALLPHPNSTHG
jgi:hypothetical protein